MIATTSLPPTTEINPYESPLLIAEECHRAPAENGWGLFQRSGLYALTGGVLYAAFCSPLDFCFSNLFTHELWIGTTPAPLMAILASSLIAGLIVDPLVRLKVPSALTGLGFVLLNSILFTLILGAIGNWERPDAFERTAKMIPWAFLLGPLGAVLCIHLVVPIGIGMTYLAGRMANESEESAM